MDLSLYKNINISKRVKAQLRFEVFNLFNRVNFLAGQPEQHVQPDDRHLRRGDPATATTITGYTLPLGFGQASATRDPRQAQFGIKLTF